MQLKAFTLFLLIASTLSAIAESSGGEGTSKPSPLATLIASLLPFLVMGGVLYWYLRKHQSSSYVKELQTYMVRHQEHMTKSEQHMVNTERSLERIASALEKRNSDGANKN